MGKVIHIMTGSGGVGYHQGGRGCMGVVRFMGENPVGFLRPEEWILKASCMLRGVNVLQWLVAGESNTLLQSNLSFHDNSNRCIDEGRSTMMAETCLGRSCLLQWPGPSGSNGHLPRRLSPGRHRPGYPTSTAPI